MVYYNYFAECRKTRKEFAAIFSVKFLILMCFTIALCLVLWFSYQQVVISQKQKSLNNINKLLKSSEYVASMSSANSLKTDLDTAQKEQQFLDAFAKYLDDQNVDVKGQVETLFKLATEKTITITIVSFDGVDKISLTGTALTPADIREFQSACLAVYSNMEFSSIMENATKDAYRFTVNIVL